ncbi:MAG: YraN family protein [Deltaproteobacteria bacterium]|nr:YraN family protein [Deltaproteobacteria bacterium]
MTHEKARMGGQGENVAARFLEEHGYRVLARNVRTGGGEIDLVVEQGEYLVFVEVKSRSVNAPVHPSQSVTKAKQARLRKLGERYMVHGNITNRQPRFDVISVIWEKDNPRVEHLVNAF